MTVKQTHAAPSLLPYLTDRGSGVRLKLERFGSVAGPGPRSLTAMEGAGPFTRILKGRLTADGSTAFTHLFLLVQPDTYAVEPSALKPVSNTEVDAQWQSAWVHLKGAVDNDTPIVFPEQIDEMGQLVPFRPFFHCRHKDRFAQTLCPECGGFLSLCRDDALLADAGLPAYGKSLDRYLYCPECHASKRSSTYYTLDGSAPPGSGVMDCSRLIEGFSALLAKTELGEDLACVGCDGAGDCYGLQTLVHQRLYPVFFYPSYMLMQPAPDVNAMEFLHLLSGATFEQAVRHLTRQKKPGRMAHLEAMGECLFTGRGLIFEDDRRFMEVLYLKLVFLDALSAMVLHPESPFCEPVADMSLESLWVRLPRTAYRLPLFWNFALQLVDPVGRPSQTVYKTDVPMARARYFLGTVWFYAFLVNAQQDMMTVQAAVDKLLRIDDISQVEEDALGEIDPAFAPHHLLWDAEPLTLDPRRASAWRHALLMGLDVLQAGYKADTQWSEERFRQQLHEIMDMIHGLIFQAPVSATEAPAIAPDLTVKAGSSDLPIARILQTILDEWPSGDHPMPDGAPPTPEQAQHPSQALVHVNEDGDYEETVILESEPESPRGAPAPFAPRADLGETVVMGKPHPTPSPLEDDQPTLIISPMHPQSTLQASSTQPGAGESLPPTPEIEETVIQGGPDKVKVNGWQEDDLPATRIITPGAAPGAPQRPEAPRPKVDGRKVSLMDALAETVVKGGRSSSPATSPSGLASPSPGEPSADQTDELEKTVILSPEKAKGRSPEK